LLKRDAFGVGGGDDVGHLATFSRQERRRWSLSELAHFSHAQFESIDPVGPSIRPHAYIGSGGRM
jgi:hypothetical protein